MQLIFFFLTLSSASIPAELKAHIATCTKQKQMGNSLRKGEVWMKRRQNKPSLPPATAKKCEVA